MKTGDDCFDFIALDNSEPQQWWTWRGDRDESAEPWEYLKCPYGSPGDRLWVRETWAPAKQGGRCSIAEATYACFPDGSQKFKSGEYYQEAPKGQLNWPSGWKWRPSIHMPRWASRITLEITEVRVQRLQDISEEDARAEGIRFHETSRVYGEGLCYPTARDAFAALWDKINGPGSWDANPWLWAITFKRIEVA